MTLVQVLPPIEMPVTLEDAKAHLRVVGDQEDLLIVALIAAALARAERESGRAFAPQSWQLVLDGFPDDEIVIPLGPVEDGVNITYVDDEGGEQAVSPDLFNVDTVASDARVVPVDGWPEAADVPNAVRVQFDLGGTCPEDVRIAILLMVAHWFQNREDASETALAAIPLGSAHLLALHRRMFV